MKFLCAEKISQHKFKTPEGYLVCVDAVLARTGKQTYKRSELFGADCKDAENEVEVDRTESEVFSDKTLASFENKPITIEHPDEDVRVGNYRDLAVGFVRDIKRGKDGNQDVMLGTLVITDEDAISEVESGNMVELSCGYDADIIDEDNPCQRNIRGNHVALCQRGRAGNARIVDSKVKDERIQKGKVYVAKSGATLKITDVEVWFSDYNGEANAIITYEFVYANGKRRGTSRANTHDFWKMLTDKSLTGDSIDDAVYVVYAEGTKAGYRALYRKADGTAQYMTEAEAPLLTEKEADKFVKQTRGKYNWIKQKIRDNNEDTMKDADFSKQSKQGYQVVEMYRDAGRLHAILKRSNDYVIAYGYDTSDGTWAQGRYDFSTLDKARQALQEEKKYAHRIADVSDYDEDDDDDLSNAEKELCDYMLKNVYEKGMTPEQLLKKMESYYSMYQRLARHKPEEVKEYFREEIRYGKYDSLKDSYYQIDMSDKDGKTHSLFVKAYSFEEAKKKAETAKPEWKFRASYQPTERDIEWAKSRGLYIDNVKDVDTYEEVTEELKSQAKEAMKRDSVKDAAYKVTYIENGMWLSKIIKARSVSAAKSIAEEKGATNIKEVVEIDMDRARRLGFDSRKDSKEDILQKIRNTQIREGDTFEFESDGYLVQIQNVGKQELSTRSGPFKSNGKNESLRLSVKLSSHAWGRIWKNRTIVFNETGPLNVVRDKMIAFLRNVRDSKRR